MCGRFQLRQLLYKIKVEDQTRAILIVDNIEWCLTFLNWRNSFLPWWKQNLVHKYFSPYIHRTIGTFWPAPEQCGYWKTYKPMQRASRQK